MYEAEITNKEILDGQIKIYVQYKKDGKVVANRQYQNNQPTDKWLPRVVKDQIRKLEELDTDESKVGDKITPQPETQTDRQKWYDLKREYAKKKELVDSGIFSAEEMALGTLRAKLKSDFRPEFLS